jgi:hypothetical protein
MNAVYMGWGRLFAGPLFSPIDAKRLCQHALVEQKKRPRFPEPLKETNTDIRLMHNVCDRIGTELQQTENALLINLAIDLAAKTPAARRYSPPSAALWIIALPTSSVPLAALPIPPRLIISSRHLLRVTMKAVR